jgi:hypothetical protein
MLIEKVSAHLFVFMVPCFCQECEEYMHDQLDLEFLGLGE